MSPRYGTRVRIALGVAVCLFAASPLRAQFGIPSSVDVGVGVSPAVITGAATGDVDGDGFEDIVAVDSVTNGSIGVARGIGGGNYAPPVLSPGTQAVGGAIFPALCDFDQDGFLDLAYADNGSTPNLYVAPGSGAPVGSFNTGALVTQALFSGDIVTDVLTTEITGDSNLDVIASARGAAAGNRGFRIMPGGGGLTFGPLIVVGTMGDVTDIDVCVSFDQDQRKDLVATIASGGGSNATVQVFKGGGAAVLPAPFASVPLPPNTEPNGVHWLECDPGPSTTPIPGPRYDLVIATQGQINGLFILRNLGPPSFFTPGALAQPVVVTNTPLSPIRLEANFDGTEDLSVFAFNSQVPGVVATDFEILAVDDCALQSISVTPGGSLDTSAVSPAKVKLHATSDQNQDGREDLLLVNHTSPQDRVLVYPNLAPVTFSITPPKPMLGTKVQFILQIDFPASLAGQPFFLMFSINGSKPGVKLGGGLTLPLNPPFTPLVIQGTVPAGGSLTLTPPSTTFGTQPTGFSLQVAGAAVALSAAGTPAFVTNPAVVTVP